MIGTAANAVYTLFILDSSPAAGGAVRDEEGVNEDVTAFAAVPITTDIRPGTTCRPYEGWDGCEIERERLKEIEIETRTRTAFCA